MNSDFRIIAFVLAAAIAALLCFGADIVFPADKGPSSLDVSGYPKDIQAGYNLAVKVCTPCHSMSRVLNTIAPPQFWGRFMGTLQAKGQIKITDQEGASIYDFLIYDEIYRKERTPKAFFAPLTEDEIEKLASAPSK